MTPCVINVRCFGAKGDNSTDDYPAFKAAHDATDPVLGGKIEIPDGDYYLSQSWNITRPIDIIGSRSGQVSIAATFAGPNLIFAPGQHGIITHSHNTYGDTIVPSGSHSGAQGAAVENVNIFSRGGKNAPGMPVHGLWVRTSSRIRRVNIGKSEDTGFSGNGFNFVATAGAGGELEGNGNLASGEFLTAQYNGNDGCYIQGADMNGCLFVNVNAQLNGHIGVADLSFLGNKHTIHHVAGNGFRGYRIGSPSAYHVCECLYTEGNGNNLFERPTLVIGGNSAAPGSLDPASTAIVWGLESYQHPFVYRNARGAAVVEAALGADPSDTLNTVSKFSHYEGQHEYFYSLRYNDVSKWWMLQGNNYGEMIPFMLPSPKLFYGGELRAFAPAFPYGFYIGSPGGTLVHFDVGTGPPVSEKCQKGDYRRNTNQAKGQPTGWSCTVSGAPGIPGIWESEGNL